MRYFSKLTLILPTLALLVGIPLQQAQPQEVYPYPQRQQEIGRTIAELQRQQAQQTPPYSQAPAQMGKFPHRREPYPVDSGIHTGRAPVSTVEFRRVVRVPGVPWLRLYFSDYNLGERSFITITSLKDGGYQRHDTKSLPQWGNASAYFNGDAVRIELHVAPGEENIFFRIEEILVGEWLSQRRYPVPTSICDGSDDRVASADDRVARLSMVVAGNIGSVCTAWLVSNGAMLTAGHCVDWDPDGSGPGLPDGVLDLDADDVVEFNVPASLADGTPQFANPNDQYPIDLTSVVWNFDGEGQGLGKDWAVFAALANTNTGLLPQHAQDAFFRMTRERPSVGDTVRVTGCGADGGVDNFTQQTDTGTYEGESSLDAAVWHEHRVDTQGGNSGSPIIWEAHPGFTIGIHTNGGCTDTGGANAGTSFEHDPLEVALQGFHGPNTVYVDRVSLAPVEDGTIFQPYDTVLEAANGVPWGGIVSIVKGSYNETLVITRAMTLIAPVGHVTIGQ